MNKKIISMLLLSVLIFTSCDKNKIPEGEELGYDYYAINMNTDFVVADTLERVDSKPAKVFILIGQSNASGCSYVSYLEKGITKEKYAEFEAGYKNVLINYSIDDQRSTSGGAFVKTDLTCGVDEGYFGPEVGMAEVLSSAFEGETVFILKFTMSGYSLNYHWLYDYKRASIYNAFYTFSEAYLEYLQSVGYNPTVEAICWMQGESDTSEYKAGKYYDNTVAFVSYLREDFGRYTPERGIYFIDAGISSSPYCLPSYPEINEAKKCFSDQSDLNLYFSTIDAGLTTLYEPVEEPDLGHYDALCELELGRMFGEQIVGIYKNK